MRRVHVSERLVAVAVVLTVLVPRCGVSSEVPTVTIDGDNCVREGLRFTEAVQILKHRNHQIQAAAETEHQRVEKQAATRGLRLPRIDLKARATQIDQAIVIDLEPIREAMLALHPTVPGGLLPPFQTRIQDDRFFKAEVELSWPVYTGGAIEAANRAAGARTDDARFQTRATEQELVAELARRFYALRLAEQALEVRRKVLDGMERHLYQATRLEEEGMIAHADQLHAEVARAEAARELAAARQDLALAQSALGSLLEIEHDVSPESELFILHDLPPLAELKGVAAEANPNLHRLEAQQELARSAVAAERATTLPDVAVFAVHELYPDDLTVLEPRWAAGIGVKLNLFDGFARGHRLAAAQATVATVEHLRDAARSDVALLVEANYRRALKAVEQFEALNSTVGLAEENLRVRTRAFEEGFATSLDVVDARNTLAGVRLSRLDAAHDFVVAFADLLAAIGDAESLESYAHGPQVEVVS